MGGLLCARQRHEALFVIIGFVMARPYRSSLDMGMTTLMVLRDRKFTHIRCAKGSATTAFTEWEMGRFGIRDLCRNWMLLTRQNIFLHFNKKQFVMHDCHNELIYFLNFCENEWVRFGFEGVSDVLQFAPLTLYLLGLHR